jgi:hypothetical protein
MLPLHERHVVVVDHLPQSVLMMSNLVVEDPMTYNIKTH